MPAIGLTCIGAGVVVTPNPQPDGTVTLTIGINDPTLKRDDGSPCQPGDVLSIQVNGTRQTRKYGSNGPFEVCLLDGNLATYCPDGIHVYAYPYPSKVPNV